MASHFDSSITGKDKAGQLVENVLMQKTGALKFLLSLPTSLQ